MKLFRFGQPWAEKPAVIFKDKRLYVSSLGGDFNETFLLKTASIDCAYGWKKRQRTALK